jgi:hypothetical protein
MRNEQKNSDPNEKVIRNFICFILLSVLEFQTQNGSSFDPMINKEIVYGENACL